MVQLVLAELSRWLSLFCLVLCLIFERRHDILVGATFIDVRAWEDGFDDREYSFGMVWCAIALALRICHFLTYLLSLIFYWLSFVYCFKTDNEFEFHYAVQISNLSTHINQILSLTNISEQNETDIAETRDKIIDLEIERERERVRRFRSSTENCCCRTTQVVPVAVEIVEESAEDFEEPLRRGIERFVLQAETVAVDEAVNVLVLEKQNASLTTVTDQIHSGNMTQDETLLQMRRSIYCKFNYDLNEIRLKSRRDARMRIRASVNRTIMNEAQSEDIELIDHLNNLASNA